MYLVMTFRQRLVLRTGLSLGAQSECSGEGTLWLTGWYAAEWGGEAVAATVVEAALFTVSVTVSMRERLESTWSSAA